MSNAISSRAMLFECFGTWTLKMDHHGILAIKLPFFHAGFNRSNQGYSDIWKFLSQHFSLQVWMQLEILCVLATKGESIFHNWIDLFSCLPQMHILRYLLRVVKKTSYTGFNCQLRKNYPCGPSPSNRVDKEPISSYLHKKVFWNICSKLWCLLGSYKIWKMKRKAFSNTGSSTKF